MCVIRLACYTFALLLPTITPAQQPAVSTSPGRSITFSVSVTTRDSQPVHGLTAQDFKLLNDKAEQPIASVKEVAAGTQPLHAIIVIDAVNVPYTRVAYERDELDKFLKTNGGKLAEPTTIAILTDKGAQISNGFTTDGNELKAAFDKAEIGLRTIRRDTGIYGADERVQISLTALQQLIAYSGTLPGRKALIWISPGWPLLSGERITLSDKQQKGIFADVVSYYRQMQQAKVTLYDVNPLGPEQDLIRSDYYQSFLKGVSKPVDTDLADISLQVLAVHSGGVVSTNNSDVAGNIAKDLDAARSGYEITVRTLPPEHPEEYHHIQVTVDQPGVTVRTIDGYYSQP
jgi:VWFA-related protein